MTTCSGWQVLLVIKLLFSCWTNCNRGGGNTRSLCNIGSIAFCGEHVTCSWLYICFLLICYNNAYFVANFVDQVTLKLIFRLWTQFRYYITLSPTDVLLFFLKKMKWIFPWQSHDASRIVTISTDWSLKPYYQMICSSRWLEEEGRHRARLLVRGRTKLYFELKWRTLHLANNFLWLRMEASYTLRVGFIVVSVQYRISGTVPIQRIVFFSLNC